MYAQVIMTQLLTMQKEATNWKEKLWGIKWSWQKKQKDEK